MQTKTDLTEYSRDELSLQVYNREDLYNVRYQLNLKSVLEEEFVFTNEQFRVLEDDLEQEDV